MYKKNRIDKSSVVINQRYEGETIEQKIRRVTTNKEPITDGAPLIYTERNQGVLPEYDIRTDRFEVAAEAMDKVQKSKIAAREERHKTKEEAKVVDIKPELKSGDNTAEQKS